MSTDNPEISIIVPAYNAEEYLSVCVDSILYQSFADWELLIADDGSEDNTGMIADEYAVSDPRIKVLHLQRTGVSAARNSCLDHAKGHYIAFVDADDSIDPDYLKDLIGQAKQSNADITQCSFRYLDNAGNEHDDPDANNAVYADSDTIMHAYFHGQQGNIRVSVWAKLFAHEVVEDVRFDAELRVYEDAYFVYQCCRKAETIKCFDSPLYKYIQRKDSTTNSCLPLIWRDYFVMYERQKADLTEDRSIIRNIDRRQAETALWLMRIMISNGREQEIWNLRKKIIKITSSVLLSHAPVNIKIKVIAVALVPHLYISLLRRRVSSGNEKV